MSKAPLPHTCLECTTGKADISTQRISPPPSLPPLIPPNFHFRSLPFPSSSCHALPTLCESSQRKVRRTSSSDSSPTSPASPPPQERRQDGTSPAPDAAEHRSPVSWEEGTGGGYTLQLSLLSGRILKSQVEHDQEQRTKTHCELEQLGEEADGNP
eukprot:759802-Hanusia_phi.AAC.3